MKLTILGSGTMMPSRKRYPSAYLIEENNTRILVDCGSLTLARLVENNIDFHSINAVTISHFHTDHFSNLISFIHARWVDDRLNKQKHQTLTVIGPESIKERWLKLREIYWPESINYEMYPINFIAKNTTIDIGSINICSFPVHHVKAFKSSGYRFLSKNKTIVYTGDMSSEQKPDFIKSISGADLLLIEAGAVLPSSQSHLTVKQAVSLGKEARAKKIILTHIREAELKNKQERIQGYNNVKIAYDNQVIKI